MIGMAVLQNCMDFVEGETDFCSETSVTCDVDGFQGVNIKAEEALDIKEEVSIKIEEAIDIKDEIPEATSFPQISTVHEVRLHGVCEVGAAHSCRSFFAPTRKLWNSA